MKVFPHGKGNGASPVNYLIRLDYPKRADAPPEVLRGDPELTIELIDSLDTKWKFTAGVLSWSPEDKVSPEQEQKMMNDFEGLAFAGMQPDAYNILWVRHNHAEHHELHFVIPRVELNTGKAFNPCPPGWQKHFDVVRDLHNHKEGWARPDDPLRARLCTPDHANLQTARLIRWGKSPDKDERAEAKEAIHNYLKEKIEQGIVTERKEILMLLQGAGLEINRAGKDYITVKDTESGEKLRLKGGIYAEQWQFKASDYLGRTDQSQDRTRTRGNREPDQSTIAKLERELEAVITKRTEYNRNRYPESIKELGAESELQLPRVKTNIQLEIPTNHLDNIKYFYRDKLGGVGAYELSSKENNELTPRNHSLERTPERIGTNDSFVRGQDLGAETTREQKGAFYNHSSEFKSKHRLDNREKSSHQTGVTNDRTRTNPQKHAIKHGARDTAEHSRAQYTPEKNRSANQCNEFKNSESRYTVSTIIERTQNLVARTKQVVEQFRAIVTKIEQRIQIEKRKDQQKQTSQSMER